MKLSARGWRIAWLALIVLFGLPIPPQATDPRASSSAIWQAILDVVSRTAHAASNDGRPPQILTVAEEALPLSLNPLNVTTLVERRSIELVHDALFNINEQGQPVASLIATGLDLLPIFKKVPQMLAYNGRLVLTRFHNGTRVSVRDLDLTLRAYAAPEAYRTRRLYAGQIKQVSALLTPEDQDFRIEFERATEHPESLLTLKLLPHQAFSQPMEPTSWASDSQFERRPVGAGPFRVKESASGNLSWNLEAFSDYHRGRPALDGIKLVAYPAISEQLNALRAGQVHVLVSLNKHEQLRARSAYGALTVPYHVRNWWYLGMNCRRIPDPAIRKALSMVVDRSALARRLAPEVIEAATGSTRSPPLGEESALDRDPSVVLLSGPFVPESPFYNRHVPHARQNLEEAGRLLQRARGFSFSRRSAEWQRDGKPWELNLAVRRDLPAYEELLALLRQQLRDFGINLKVQVLDQAGWERQVVRAGQRGSIEFDLVLGRWNVDTSDDIRPIFDSKGTLNFLGFSSPEVDALFARAAEESDYDRRVTLMQRLHQRLADELPALFLWQSDQVAAFHRRVGGYKLHSYAFYVNPHKWYLRSEEAP